MGVLAAIIEDEQTNFALVCPQVVSLLNVATGSLDPMKATVQSEQGARKPRLTSCKFNCMRSTSITHTLNQMEKVHVG